MVFGFVTQLVLHPFHVVAVSIFQLEDAVVHSRLYVLGCRLEA